ncbi:MAG: CotH kinase family protein [Lachnospiraceae bacterium]|nr:CotH kinase family protein [Lachnospiraceae bacterium]
MKKDELVLVFMTVLLCAAAFAAASGALTDPFRSGGAVEAFFEDKKEWPVETCFVDGEQYKDMLSGKKQKDFDVSAVAFEKMEIPYDEKDNTVYIPQDRMDDTWTGSFSLKAPYTQICIINDRAIDKKQCLEENRTFKTALVSDGYYMECNLVFTGLPAVCMCSEKGEVGLNKEYAGRICVLDPYRKEYQEADCSFHIRGATSTMFDKKSYRVELTETDSGSDKMSFLGLRKDDDWILNSICTDKSLAREKVCYDLWKRLNETEERPVASSQIEYCELILNNEYMGVYGLMYPIDKKLMGMNPGDLLYKVGTWYEEIDFPGRLTDYNGKEEIHNRSGVSYLEIKYPKEPEKSRIYDPFQLYQDMVFETGDMSEMNKAGIILNLDNFIVHELFCEMTRAGDNTWKNIYIAAYSNGRGGYTLNETIWDLNYTFGDQFKWDPDHGNTVFLPDSTDAYKTRFDRDYGYIRLSTIIDDLREDTANKWKKWRSGGISPEYVNTLFREQKEYLEKSGAFERNSRRWSAGGENDVYFGISSWISGRFLFLDQMYGYES